MKYKTAILSVGILLLSGMAYSGTQADVKALPKTSVFTFQQTVVLDGSPDTVYDYATGDISGWWDHSFSKKPYRLFIEAKPGGGFYEIFSKDGDGVLHATVTAAQRGKLLRMDGPLGLAGRALHMVCTYTFTPVDDTHTELNLSVHMAGEIDVKTAAIVEQVWHHFLFDRLKVYAAGGGHMPAPVVK
jgi:uncharacterized protein YndB with AHSA1/START domain